MARTFLELVGFHGARAARSLLAVPRAERPPLRRTTKSPNGGREFSVAQGWRRLQKFQWQRERHSWEVQESASQVSRLADAAVSLPPALEVRRTLGLAPLLQGPLTPKRAEPPMAKRIAWQQQQQRRRRD